MTRYLVLTTRSLSRWKWGIGFVAAVIALAGCTVGPNYQAPQIVVGPSFSELEDSAAAVNLATTRPTTAPAPRASRASGRAMPVIDWWTTFNDPLLDSLIAQAVQSNLDIRQAEARIREARAERAIYTGNEYPTANFSGTASKTRISKNGFPIPIGSGGAGASGGSSFGNGGSGGNTVTPFATNSASGGGAASSLFSKSEFDLYQMGFDASWELDVFGGIRRGTEAADADLAASIENRRDVLVTLLAEVARNYIELRGFQNQRNIALENLKSQQQTLFLTQDRFKAGLTSDLDVSRAAALVANTASQIPTLVNQERQAVHGLGLLLGQSPNALSAQLSINKPIPPLPTEVSVGLPAELLRRRPDIRRAERQLAAATARVGVATADLYPKFSLTGSFAFQSLKPKSLLDWNSRTFQIGPAVSWPIFDAGRIRANVRVQNARQEEAMAAYQKTVLTALRDVENALSAYSTEQLRRRALEDAVTANRTSVELANQQYDRGVADFLTVLDAQRSLFMAEDQLVQSDRTMSTNLVALYKALGGGWQTPYE